MLRSSMKWTILLLLLLNSVGVSAAQILEGTSDDSFTVILARKEPSLIRVDGRKIRRIVGAEDVFTVTPDAETGSAYLFITGDKSVCTLYVVDDAGKQWKLLAQIRDVPGDTILIRDAIPTPPVLPSNDMPLSSAVRSMIEKMYSNDDQLTKIVMDVPLWKETRFQLVALLDAFNLSGEKYLLTNISSEVMQLDEREFYKPGVLGIAIDRPLLPPHVSTYVYVVRRDDGILR